ncbi:MAG TPA: hypothetical protein PK711_01730 [Bacteroidales bacterium]|nr:hypothetical protein [Bacteroidales bacterium]HRZ20326.1 hypothetical protein [Bacteroidales bacterium]
MSHWLEDEINKLKEKELNLNPALVKQNYMKNAALINGFFNLLKKSFDDLTRVMGKDYKFTYRTLSVLKICDNEFIEFSGINFSQKPAFLRRLQFILTDTPGRMQVILFRGKHDHPEDSWKFHDKQEFTVPVEKMDQDLVNELVDWFAWKSYSPRSIRE